MVTEIRVRKVLKLKITLLSVKFDILTVHGSLLLGSVTAFLTLPSLVIPLISNKISGTPEFQLQLIPLFFEKRLSITQLLTGTQEPNNKKSKVFGIREFP